MTRTQVAVVGAGVSGLTAAWYLSRTEAFRKEYEVTLYEVQSKAGLGSESIKMNGKNDSVVDVPTRIVNGDYYKNLSKVYQHAGIEMTPLQLSTCWNDVNTKLCYLTLWNWSLCGFLIPCIKFSASDIFGFLLVFKLFFEYVWFVFFSSWDWEKLEYESMDLTQYLKVKKYSKEFSSLYLFPTYSVICSCSFEQVGNFPWKDISRFAKSYFFNSYTLLRVVGGQDSAAAALLKNVSLLRTNCKVASIHKENGRLKLVLESGEEHLYDHVVVATQASQTVNLLKSCASKPLLDCLNQFCTVKTTVVVHHDESLMPTLRKSWNALNIFSSSNRGECMFTAWHNSFQPDLGNERHIFATGNPLVPIAKEKILRVSQFDRSIVDASTPKNIEKLWDLQGIDNIWICGAYASQGIPLLENGVTSALTVAERISDSKRPW